MKKLVNVNNVISVGNFCGPDIEEGTFHEEKTDNELSHKGKRAQCPCPPFICHGIAPEDENQVSKNDTNNS